MRTPFKGDAVPARALVADATGTLREPPIRETITIADLIERHRQASNWTADNDGEAFNIADEIRIALMADCDLSRVDADYILKEII